MQNSRRFWCKTSSRFSASNPSVNQESWAYQHRDELEAFINLLYSSSCVLMRNNYPGCELENVRFPIFSRKKGIAYIVLSVIIPYALSKLAKSKSDRIKLGAKRAQTILKIVDLLFFLKFLYKNGSINLIHFLFNINYSIINPKQRRFLDNEYLNKTIIWGHFATFLLTVLPILKTTIFPALMKKLYLYSSYIGPFLGSSNLNEDEFKRCIVCQSEKPTNPCVNQKWAD